VKKNVTETLLLGSLTIEKAVIEMTLREVKVNKT
jgi:hypothetical protein